MYTLYHCAFDLSFSHLYIVFIDLLFYRTRQRLQSAPIIKCIPSTPKVSKVTVQPQQPGNLEHQVNTINRSSSAVILSGSYLQQQAANKMKLSDSSPHLSVPHTSECVKSTSVNSSSYSHLFPGRFLHTMRKVSTSTDLPCPCNGEDMKPTLIHVKPIDTMEQI